MKVFKFNIGEKVERTGNSPMNLVTMRVIAKFVDEGRLFYVASWDASDGS